MRNHLRIVRGSLRRRRIEMSLAIASLALILMAVSAIFRDKGVVSDLSAAMRLNSMSDPMRRLDDMTAGCADLIDTRPFVDYRAQDEVTLYVYVLALRSLQVLLGIDPLVERDGGCARRGTKTNRVIEVRM